MLDKYSECCRKIKDSLREQEVTFKDTLILNPVENVPDERILQPASSFLHGLYNTDTVRTSGEKYKSKIQFSGRDKITEDVQSIYDCWAKLLHANKISMRLLSGLHAHTVLFMALTNIGDKVLILPEKAGGHTSGKAILERLGLVVEELPIDYNRCRIDADAALRLAKKMNPVVIFVDRSEGLIYEDFSWVAELPETCCKVFDGSQYLTNIIAGDYKNPFDMGFDFVLSTMHKNLPGPQRALICAKEDNDNWRRLKSGISTFVSNMHVFSIYSAGLMLDDVDSLCELSKNMLKNAAVLDAALDKLGVPIVKRNASIQEPLTHHCWILPSTREKAFEYSIDLERLGFLVNYRLLPYNLGFGLRLGLSGATKSGLCEEQIDDLALILSAAYKSGFSSQLKKDSRDLIRRIKESR